MPTGAVWGMVSLEVELAGALVALLDVAADEDIFSRLLCLEKVIPLGMAAGGEPKHQAPLPRTTHMTPLGNALPARQIRGAQTHKRANGQVRARRGDGARLFRIVQVYEPTTAYTFSRQRNLLAANPPCFKPGGPLQSHLTCPYHSPFVPIHNSQAICPSSLSLLLPACTNKSRRA